MHVTQVRVNQYVLHIEPHVSSEMYDVNTSV